MLLLQKVSISSQREQVLAALPEAWCFFCPSGCHHNHLQKVVGSECHSHHNHCRVTLGKVHLVMTVEYVLAQPSRERLIREKQDLRGGWSVSTSMEADIISKGESGRLKESKKSKERSEVCEGVMKMK